jgi:hypothetical protein
MRNHHWPRAVDVPNERGEAIHMEMRFEPSEQLDDLEERYRRELVALDIEFKSRAEPLVKALTEIRSMRTPIFVIHPSVLR